MTISTERLRKIVSGSDFVADVGGKQSETVTEIARELLAVREAQSVPFAYMHRSGQVITREECGNDEVFAICCKVETPLYTAPPAPAVPGEANEHSARMAVGFNRYMQAGYIDGWNACRDAMLAAAPTPTKEEVQQISPIKPVLFANEFDLKNGWADHAGTVTEARQGYTAPLYAAPLLLDEIKDHKLNSGDKADDYHAGYQSGWNEYRDAIISAINSAENGDVSKD